MSAMACSLTEGREVRMECWHRSLSICDLMFAYEVVSCGQMCAVRCCECWMNNERPKVVGAGTKSCGVRT